MLATWLGKKEDTLKASAKIHLKHQRRILLKHQQMRHTIFEMYPVQNFMTGSKTLSFHTEARFAQQPILE